MTFTPEEDKALIEAYNDPNMSSYDLEEHMGIDRMQIYKRVKELGLKKTMRARNQNSPLQHNPRYREKTQRDERKLRECLRCHDMFMSDFCGHRICDPCRLAPYRMERW